MDNKLMKESGITVVECKEKINDDYTSWFLEITPGSTKDLMDLFVPGERYLIRCMQGGDRYEKYPRVAMNEKSCFSVNGMEGEPSYRFNYDDRQRIATDKRSWFWDSDKCMREGTYYFKGTMEEFLSQFRAYYDHVNGTNGF